MAAPVHIAADREGDVPVLIHPDDPDCVLPVEVPRIHVLCLRKPEDAREGTLLRHIGPEHILLNKCNAAVFGIRLVLNLLLGDAQIDSILRQDTVVLRIKNLVRHPLKIQQIDTAVRIPQPVVLMDIINLLCPGFRDRGNAVIHRHRRCIFIDLRQPRRRLIKNLRIQLPPCQSLNAVMNVHIRQRVILVGRIVRLDRLSDRIQVRLIDAFIPEAGGKVQVIGRVKSIRQKHMRIVIDVPPAGSDLDLQHIFLIHQDLVHQRQICRDRVAVLIQLDHLRILQRLGPVDGGYLVGHGIHCCSEGLNLDRDPSCIRERCDAVTQLRGVDLPAVPMQLIEVHAILLHADQRKCRTAHDCRGVRCHFVDHAAESDDTDDEQHRQKHNPDQQISDIQNILSQGFLPVCQCQDH